MAPIWERTRKMGASAVGHEYEIHETSDPDFLIAELTFHVEHDGYRIDVPFVQFFWTSGGKIVAVREYFSPRVRCDLDEKK